MIFLQLIHEETSTFTYLLGDPASRQAILIDPVLEEVERYESLLLRLGLILRHTLETHVHADHVSGGGRLRERLNSTTVMHESGGAGCADIKVKDGDTLTVGAITIEVRYTPGHTSGCTSYLIGDRVFTGDALLIGKCGRTDFQQGDAAQLYDSVHEKLFSLPSDTLVFPGHDYQGNLASTIGWERTHNARLGGGRSREAFVEIMDNLNLRHPKHIDRAVPANLRCGLPEPDAASAASDSKAAATGASTYEDIPPARAMTLMSEVRLLDVREASERSGPLGHIEGSLHIPIVRISEAIADWSREAPLILVCRSGGRSQRAAVALAKSGFQTVYNLAGGMQAWNAAQLPVVRTATGA